MKILALLLVLLAACTPEPPPPPATSDEIPTDARSLFATVEALKDKLKDKPRDFNINLALGNLYYENEKYIESVEYYDDALKIAMPVKARLLATARPKTPVPVPTQCLLEKPGVTTGSALDRTRTLEVVAAAADALEKKNAAAADACRRELVALLANTFARRGNAWYLGGNPDKAREDHAAALALDPQHGEALFFIGALELELANGDPAKLELGRKYWQALLDAHPEHPRATLVRETLPRLREVFGLDATVGPAPLSPELQDNLDSQVVASERALTESRWQEALDGFKRVMPLRPSGRVALGLGIALRELGKPTAERVLTEAARMPGGNASRARLELAKLYEKTNPAEATRIYIGLAGDPEVGTEAKARFAKLP